MFRLKNKWVFCLFVWAFFYSVVQADEAVSDSFHEKVKWSDVLSLPSVDSDDNLGVAGAYSGFVGDYLVVAGGANFPDAKPWNGGRKTWWNVLYYKDMENVDSDWLVERGILPSALAYGVSIQLPEGVLCIGGCDSVSCSSDVFLIRMRNGKILIDDNWPSLPVPLASATGALLDDKIYIAGGHKDISKQEATSYFFELDLADKKKGWKELPSWPGSPRGYAVSAVQNDGFDKCFYLFSGRDYHVDGSVEVLEDGYVYNPCLDKWKKLEGRFPFMAGTAAPQGVNHILFVGGSDTLISGSDTHPGFSNALFAYHTVTCTLKEVARSPFPLAVTTNIAYREKTFYITSGEVKPGVRTPSIVSFTIEPYEKGISVLNALVIALYFSILSWMGYYFSKKQKNTDDYFKGGGRIPWWVVGLSIFGTGLSAITFMAIPAKAYSTDWSYMLMNAGILMVVPVILYMFIPFFRRLNITTAYEYLEKRFNYSVRLICSLSFILFQIGRMGVVLYLPAIALNVVTGFDIFLCIGFIVLMFCLSILDRSNISFVKNYIEIDAGIFPTSHRSRAYGIYQMGVPLACIFGGLISGAILEYMPPIYFKNWQWMFIIQELATVLVGIIAFFLLSSKPQDITWLTNKEKEVLLQSLQHDKAETKKHSILSSIPWIAVLIALPLLTSIADYLYQWRVFAICLLSLAVMSMVCASLSNNIYIFLLFMNLAAIGFIVVQPIFWNLPTQMLSDKSAVVGLALIGSLGNLGGFAPNLKSFVEFHTHNHKLGLIAVALVAVFGIVALLSLKTSYHKQGANYGFTTAQ